MQSLRHPVCNYPGAVLCRQWSWPLWLPVQFFGIFPTTVLKDNDASTPWADEIEQKLFASAVGEPLPC